MNEHIRRLHKQFKDTFPSDLCTLTITRKKSKLYFKTTGCFRREAWDIIDAYFPGSISLSRNHQENIHTFSEADE